MSSLYRLSLNMRILIDVRESALIEKCIQIMTVLPVITQSLPIGDAMIQNESGGDVLLFERKSLSDLLASIKDGRYEEQSHRIIHTSGLHSHNVIYVVEGLMSTVRNPMDKRIIQSAMTSLSYFKGFSVFRTSTIQETAETICSMALKLHKEFEKGKRPPVYAYPATITPISSSEGLSTIDVPPIEIQTPPPSYSAFVKKTKHENITRENIGEILLCQIPGISSSTATEILKQYGGSFSQFMEELKTNPDKLNTIYLESSGKRRKLGTNIIQNIQLYLGETKEPSI
jgi:ERCC4-type nuclease